MANNIQSIYINEEEYSGLLAKIQDPPKKIYCVGDVSLLKTRCVAIVGSRKATGYGRWAATTLASRLAQHNITVVSGMAGGIDTCAHRGALEEGGKTIAVLGCGVNKCYPATNRSLKQEIIRHGLLISEYPPDMEARPYTFPKRNRIISGLSDATAVIEAGIKSGSLITAEAAAEQGRTVYAVPGNINNIQSFGTNQLLRDGAQPLVVLDDILEDMGIETKETKSILVELGSDEKEVYSVLKERGEMTIDEISRNLEKPVQIISGIVTILEIKGIIKTALGKIFIAK